MKDLTPMNGTTVRKFLDEYRKLKADEEVSVEEFAARLDWDVERTRTVAEWAHDRALIDGDSEMGTGLVVIEGR